MLVDPATGRLSQEQSLAELPEQFYERLNSLIEAAQSLSRVQMEPKGFVPEGDRRQGTDDRRTSTDLGNLEALRSGISHATLVRQRISLRRRRDEMFPPGLFADPAWDMLLDLYGAHIAQHRVPVSSLCIAAAVPATTALRWIGKLEKSGMIQRRSDPHDGRRVFIELTADAIGAMERFFDVVGGAPVHHA